ncbi:hypothetical protein GQ600_25408 [Phytophthora cactorum]|nr:hypothetical protein GQ600_25408 [Phytophthora cactorum]
MPSKSRKKDLLAGFALFGNNLALGAEAGDSSDGDETSVCLAISSWMSSAMYSSLDGWSRDLADFLSVGGHTAATLLSKRVVCELLSFKADDIFLARG